MRRESNRFCKEEEGEEEKPRVLELNLLKKE